MTNLISIPFQPVSIEIYNTKYRLTDDHDVPVDEDMEATKRRVCRALADIEAKDTNYWYAKFMWAMDNGATPAGRILSNAGAGKYKPNTSLINCTVSGIVNDNVWDIGFKVAEAMKTLAAGCGIGYEFSTLRPKGAFVAGVGAVTSGAIPFMDIYDRACFTIASAGGRRGAQMATFDVRHPDVFSFIKAKREDGRFRQFNLSLLITDAFVEAVKTDSPWNLVFPMTLKQIEVEGFDLNDTTKVSWEDWPVHEGYKVDPDTGKVACKIYETIRARDLWDTVMKSTYDFAEPGFLLIDKINQYNPLYWMENIRSTNPCVTGDTRLHTSRGLVKAIDLFNTGEDLTVTVDNRALGSDDVGVVSRKAVPMFMTSDSADVFRVRTKAGYEIKATDWHDFYTERGKVKLKDLRVGDKLWVQSGKGQFGCQGDEAIGSVIGWITGDGHFTNRGKSTQAAVISLWGSDRVFATSLVETVNTLINDATKPIHHILTPVAVSERKQMSIRSVRLAKVLEAYDFTKETKLQVPEVIWQGTEACVKGYLRALFQADGTVNVSGNSLSCSVRLASSAPELLKDIQMLLANFGILSKIYKRRDAGDRLLPDGKGGKKLYACQTDFELVLDGQSRDIFMSEIGFLGAAKNEKYLEWLDGKSLSKNQDWVSEIVEITYLGKEAVYDTTQKDKNTVIFNGLVTGQCGEQPLPPYGSCLLGSINLTKFVRNPFTPEASFDWENYKEVIHVFTRMLDNVVEINGLPLPQQREEIKSKRRHGMGFLGLGSALAMLCTKYNSDAAVEFTGLVSKHLAIEGFRAGVELATEKGVAPVLAESYPVEHATYQKSPALRNYISANIGSGLHWSDGLLYKGGEEVRLQGKILHATAPYFEHFPADLINDMIVYGSRFTHHSSIAPTGTISLSWNNNASNGIEPSFNHHYIRNVVVSGQSSKQKSDVFSFELLAYRHLVNPNAMPFSDNPENALPDYFSVTDDLQPIDHIRIQAAAQPWIDSCISKTANVPTDYPFEDFQKCYMQAYDAGLKGFTTFRFNPEAFQGVLVNAADLKATTYEFTLEDGQVLTFNGSEEVEYEGETHGVANLYDALKEGYYGKF